jgi:CPA2 family monovalent cation:H+ antiporter-2
MALLALILAALGIVVWRSAADLQGHVRAAAEAIVDAIRRQGRPGESGDGARALERAYRLVPGLGDPIPVRIGGSPSLVGRRLSDLELRGRTGATIVAISRGDEVVLVPDGHVVLEAGDVVALAGTRPAVEAARRLLSEPDAGDEVREGGGVRP